MPGAVQRDFITELEDAKRVDSVEMQAVVNRLPCSDLLSVAEVADALRTSIHSVYELIQCGSLRALNAGTRSKPYFRVFRVSVLNYLRKAIV